MEELDINKLTPIEIKKLGFPYPKFSQKHLKLFQDLINLDVEEIIDGNTIIKTTNYASIATVFFPHIWEAKVTGCKSPVEAFRDVRLLGKAIDMAKQYEGKATLSAIRSKLMIVSGTQCVSNFRPEVAKLIYNRYGNRGAVFDFSMGYGGRLVGFLASDCREYVGTDVNTRNYPCYHEMLHHLPSHDKKIRLFRCPSENFHPNSTALEYDGKAFQTKPLKQYKEYFDLAFSSPPYYRNEIYSDDPDQSCIKYQTYRSWLFSYLLMTIRNCIELVKPDGKIIINIADTKIGGKAYPLENDTLLICKMEGLKLKETLWMNMTKTMGHGKGWRKEPIFIFQKT